MDVTRHTNSPYISSSKQEQNSLVLGAIIEQIVDFVVHTVLRFKRKQLKFDVSPELVEAYRLSLSPTWVKIEQIRRDAINQRRRYLLLAAIPFTVSILLMLFTQFGLLPAIVTCFVTMVYVAKQAVLFKQRFIKEIMPELLVHLPRYHYKRDGYIPVKELERSKLIPDYDDTLTRQEDFFELNADGVHFELVECELAKFRYEKGERRRSTVFKGLVSRSTFEFTAKHNVILQCKWWFFLRWLQPKAMASDRKVKLSEDVLGGRYDIYSTDSKYTEEIFTKSVFAKIESLINNLDVAAPELSVVGGQIIVLLHRPRNFLQAPNLGQLKNMESFVEGILKDTYLMEELRSIAALLVANIARVK